MPRWAVRKRPRTDEWYAFLNKGLNVRCAQFSSWHAAMRFVDKQVRTVPVTLPAPILHPPRDVHRPAWHVSGGMIRPWVASIDQVVHVSDWEGHGEQIAADLAEKYALALLAAAKHAKGEQP